MKRLTWLFALSSCLASAGASAADQILTFGGLGPVRIGMTVPQAEAALGAKLKPLDTSDGESSEACWFTQRADGIDRLVSYMVWDRKIVRIDIDESEVGKEERSVPPVATERGIRIGSTEGEIKKQYGSNLIISTHPYGDESDDDHYMRVFSKDRRRGILFETWEGKVSTFRSGTAKAIELAEGCS